MTPIRCLNAGPGAEELDGFGIAAPALAVYAAMVGSE